MGNTSIARTTVGLLLLISTGIVGQIDNVQFTREFGRDGLLLGKINAMARDNLGAMWLSDQNNGSIVRFDGTQMVVYHHRRDDDSTLGGYYPECLAVDPTDKIWIGFYGQGLDKFDPVTEYFTHYRFDDQIEHSIPSDTVSVILIDRAGTLWLGTTKGLARMDRDGVFTTFAHNPSDPNSLSFNEVRALYEDRDGTLWVGTGLPWNLDSLGGLNRFDKETETFQRFVHDPNDPTTLIDNKVRAIYEDKSGNFWVGTRGDGLHLMDRATGTFQRISSEDCKPGMPCRPPVVDMYDHITFINEDALGYLWIGTLSNGLARFSPESGKSVFFHRNNSRDKGFKDASAWAAYSSEDGLFWISTQEADLFKVTLHVNQLPHIHDRTVMSFAESPEGKILTASWEGVFELDQETNTLNRWDMYQERPMHLNDDGHAEIIAIDKEGMYWISTRNGLVRISPDGKQKIFRNDPVDTTSLRYNATGILKEGRGDDLWIGTWGGGLHYMNRRTEEFTSYSAAATDSTGVRGLDIMTIFLDSRGNVWVGANEGILNRIDRLTGQVDYYQFESGVMDVHEEADGTIMVATWFDVLYLDPVSGRIRSFQDVHGKHIDGSWMLLPDSSGNLWMANDKGFIRFDSTRKHLHRFGSDSGVERASANVSARYVSSKGEVFVGSENGYWRFDPESLITFNSPTNSAFVGLEINGVPVDPGTDATMNGSIMAADQIVLRHDQNTFGIHYSIIDFSHVQDQYISHKLENHDQEWQMDFGDQRTVEYYGLAPGNYRLVLRSSNLNTFDFVDNSIDIIIKPPWWRTWWAYIFYGLALLALIWVVHKTQRARVIRKERERTRERELAQAKEIEKAYTELKNTQKQLIHAEKMASLGELTAGIAHEIQNPLNFVNNFAEVNAELIAELKEEIAKGNSNEINALADDIASNEDKVIYHGKRADAIVKSMLQHSRGSKQEKETTDVNALVDECVRLAYHGMRAKNRSFNCDYEIDLDEKLPNLSIIRQDIGRVILNLTTNAFHAVAERQKHDGADYKPKVTISTQQSNGNINISVQDNGVGIPKDALNKIFQPFFTTKPTGEGTGLGLSISYEIITNHNGKLDVTTKPGHGTDFIITLPKN